MASSCPLSVGLLETPSGGSHLPPDGGGDGTPQDRAVMYLMPLRAKEHSGMWLFPAPPSLCTEPGTGWRVPSRAEQCGGAGGCICLILSLSPFSKHPVPLSVPFGGRGRRIPLLSLNLPRQQPHAASPATPQGRASGCQVAPEIWGQTSPRPSGRAVGSEAAGGRLAGVPCSWGSVAVKHLRDGSAHSDTQGPSPPHSPCILDLGMCLGRAPGPHPGQRRAVTVTRGSLFIVTNRRN